jgi:hypothetical protein
MLIFLICTEVLQTRLHRRLVKLAKWADSSSDDRHAEFKNAPLNSTNTGYPYRTLIKPMLYSKPILVSEVHSMKGIKVPACYSPTRAAAAAADAAATASDTPAAPTGTASSSSSSSLVQASGQGNSSAQNTAGSSADTGAALASPTRKDTASAGPSGSGSAPGSASTAVVEASTTGSPAPAAGGEANAKVSSTPSTVQGETARNSAKKSTSRSPKLDAPTANQE